MRKLNEQQLISLLPPDNDAVCQAISAFESVAPVNSYSKGYLAKAVAEGHYIPLQVNLQDVPHQILFFSVTLDGGLWIHAAQTIKPYHIDLTFAAAETLRQQQQCSYIRFMTIRAGMVRAAQNHGYIVEGVVISKR